MDSSLLRFEYERIRKQMWVDQLSLTCRGDSHEMLTGLITCYDYEVQEVETSTKT
jgi:hypothetical protein